MRRARVLAACVVAVAAVVLSTWVLRGGGPTASGDRTAPAGPRDLPHGDSEPAQPVDARTQPESGSPVDRRREAGTGSGIAAPTVDGPAPARDSAERVAQLPVYLDREMVRGLMADRVALSEALEPIEKTVEGYRMLRLARTLPGDLYGLLGLEAGDVLVMVNEQSIHEGENALWDLLDREAEVRVWVMRQGTTPRHFTYRFE